MTALCIVIAVVSFILGLAASIFFDRKPMGVLHVDRTHDEKDYWTLEILDLNQVEKKSSITLRVDVKG